MSPASSCQTAVALCSIPKGNHLQCIIDCGHLLNAAIRICPPSPTIPRVLFLALYRAQVHVHTAVSVTTQLQLLLILSLTMPRLLTPSLDIRYMISPEDLVRVKLFLIKELPILEVSGASSKIDIEFDKQTVSQAHNYISSVYLDNETCKSYHERINKEEGAQLFRVRW